jgi:hypothetical protein
LPFQIGICDDQGTDIRVLTEALYAYEPSFQISSYTDAESTMFISNMTLIGRYTREKMLKANFCHPALCILNTNGDGARLVYMPEAANISLDPVVIAILGASSYYKELEQEYGNISK